MTVLSSGWQQHPVSRVWHFYAGSYWYSFSICQKQTKRPWPLSEEPESFNLCDKCIREMRRVVKKLEARNDMVQRGSGDPVPAPVDGDVLIDDRSVGPTD